MLTILVQPVLKFMRFLYTVGVYVLTASYYIGRLIFLVLIQACNIICDISTTVAIIGEELFRFLGELNTSIEIVSNYVQSSADGGINCVLEGSGILVKHTANFFLNTRMHSKLLATHIGSFINGFVNIVRNALLLIADSAWWIITLLPRCLLSATITVGDNIVCYIISIYNAFLLASHIFIQDLFRLTVGIGLVILLLKNYKRLYFIIFRWILKLKRLISFCFQIIIRNRVGQISTTATRILSIQKRSPLPRANNYPANNNKILDPAQRCVICRDRQKCVLLLPCKHLCLCEDCADYIFFAAQRVNCPLCRTVIDHSMSVYI